MTGAAFGPWRLGPLLGIGGHAEVRVATRAGGPPVALKRLLPMLRGHAAAEAAFAAEQAALQRVRHPSVVALVDHGVTRGVPWLALELVPGDSALRVARRGALPAAVVDRVAGDVAAALAACHAAGVVHGDVAPGNVLLSQQGHAVLSDFGLATVDDAVAAARPGLPTAGTPGFVDPRVLAGAPRSPQSDLWGLGALGLALRLGRPPTGDPREQPLDPPSPWIQACFARETSAAALADALKGSPRGPLAARCADLKLPVAAAEAVAAEDRGEPVTDPFGETVTRDNLD